MGNNTTYEHIFSQLELIERTKKSYEVSVFYKHLKTIVSKSSL